MTASTKRIASIENKTTHIDSLTGEVLHESTTLTDISGLTAEPAYIKLYIDDLGGLCRLTAGETKILLQVAALANYSGVIALPAGIKSEIAAQVGCKPAVVNNALTSFCNSKVMVRRGIGVYELNPDYFARGKWREIRERRKAFQSITTYLPDGNKIVETNMID